MPMTHRSVHGAIFKLLWLVLITLTTTHAAASSSQRPSYYEILGVDRSVNDKDLKKAYRKASLKYHPDKKGGSEEKFKEVNQAYDTLSDPTKRQVYDLYGEAGVESGAGSGGPDAASYGFSPGGGGGNPFFGGAGGGDGTSPFQSFFTGQDGMNFQQRSFNFGGEADGGGMNIDLSDLLRQMMGGQEMGGGGGRFSASGPSYSQQSNHKPKSYKRKLKCTLEDLATGKTKKMKVTFGRNEKIYSIPIKPGWKSGTKVTFKGNHRPGGIPTMVFEVEELPHRYLKRNGDDLIYICRITDDQARRGGGIKIKIPLPTGETWTHVFPRDENAKISNGQRHFEANKGMPKKGGPERGKLIVEFRIRPSSSQSSSP